MSFAAKAIKYFTGLKTPELNFKGTELVNPYSSVSVKKIVREFFLKFYNDDMERLFVIGINPGRFGGGITGISFTDPVALRESCGIENNLGNRKELSSKFFYSLIESAGGAEKFFFKIFLTALYPFALVKQGKNYNYYDNKSLAQKLENEIVKNISEQITFGARNDLAIILGRKNADYFSRINDKHNFFNEVIVLEHPRYVMQYKLKKLEHYLENYRKALNI